MTAADMPYRVERLHNGKPAVLSNHKTLESAEHKARTFVRHLGPGASLFVTERQKGGTYSTLQVVENR